MRDPWQYFFVPRRYSQIRRGVRAASFVSDRGPSSNRFCPTSKLRVSSIRRPSSLVSYLDEPVAPCSCYFHLGLKGVVADLHVSQVLEFDQVVRDLQNRPPGLGELPEHAFDELVPGPRDGLRQGRVRALDYLVDDLPPRARERQAAAQHGIKNAAEAPDVQGWVGPVVGPVEYLRRYVVQRPCVAAVSVHAVAEGKIPAYAEVHNFDEFLVGLREQNVFQLQVSVNDA